MRLPVDIDDNIREALDDLAAARMARADAEAREKEARDILMAACEGALTASVGSMVEDSAGWADGDEVDFRDPYSPSGVDTVAVMKVSIRTGVDSKKLRARWPDVAEQCRTETVIKTVRLL